MEVIIPVKSLLNGSSMPNCLKLQIYLTHPLLLFDLSNSCNLQIRNKIRLMDLI